MKKIILAVVFASAVMAVNAQEKPAQQKTSSEVSTQLKNDLQLNDNQAQQIQTITDKRLERQKEVEQMYSNDPNAREAKMHEADLEADAELSKILSERQYNAYLELHGRGTEIPASSETATAAGELKINVQEGQKTKVKSDKVKTETGQQETKVKDGEMKMKDGDNKMKADHEKLKVEQNGEKLKMEDNKIKYESKDEEIKIKKDEEKYKSENTKYKSEPGKTKLQQGDDKIKVKDDKTKIESKDTKVVTDKNKTVIESGDSKHKMKHPSK